MALLLQYSQMHTDFNEVAIFDSGQNMDTEEIDDDINQGMKKAMPHLLAFNGKLY